MPYTPDPTNATQPLDSEAAGTAAAEFRALKGRVNALVTSIPQSLFPVGSIYINAVNSTNPATLLGFGTWVAFGAGRVPVGFDAGNPLFDTAEETGGSANAAVVSHDHTYSSTTGTGGADHTHSFSASTGLESAGHTHSGTTGTESATHTHSPPSGNFLTTGTSPYALSLGSEVAVAANTGTQSANHTHTFTTGGVSANHTHSVSGTTGIGGASHTHSVSGTTAATGSSGANANYQPYITVYMWKRTA